MTEEARTGPEALRVYRSPWKGELVLACSKCRKRWEEGGQKSKLVKLRKEMKKARRNGSFSIVDVSCLKLCPKGGVAMCTATQLGRNECSIVRSRRDFRKLLDPGQSTLGLDRGAR